MDKVIENALIGEKQYTVVLFDLDGKYTNQMNYPKADSLKAAHDKAIVLCLALYPDADWAVSYIFEGRQEALYSHIEFPLCDGE